jgi:hypothetical protein
LSSQDEVLSVTGVGELLGGFWESELYDWEGVTERDWLGVVEFAGRVGLLIVIFTFLFEGSLKPYLSCFTTGFG